MLTGVHNFRDAGGYAATSGVVRRNVLFRSARLAAATPEDEAVLHGLGIATIVDLRRGAERDAHPNCAWTASSTTITSDLGGHADPWGEFLRGGEPSGPGVRAYVLGFYRAMPFEDRHVDLFSRYFVALAEAEAPVLVHCTAGKDRTGMAIALTHALLGVAKADMLADYLRTNEQWSYASFGAAVAETIRAQIGRPIDPEGVRAAMEVDAAYLDAAFATIEARAGSIDAYLETVLGVSAGQRARIQARLIEPRG